MGRLLGLVFIYAVMILAWSGLMLIAPARLWESRSRESLSFPGSQSGDWGKKLVLVW